MKRRATLVVQVLEEMRRLAVAELELSRGPEGEYEDPSSRVALGEHVDAQSGRPLKRSWEEAEADDEALVSGGYAQVSILHILLFLCLF